MYRQVKIFQFSFNAFDYYNSFLLSSQGGGISGANPNSQLLSGEHGGGRGHQMHHFELSKAHQEACLRYTLPLKEYRFRSLKERFSGSDR